MIKRKSVKWINDTKWTNGPMENGKMAKWKIDQTEKSLDVKMAEWKNYQIDKWPNA